MEIENFFPKYPNIFKFNDPLLNPYFDKDFNDAIVTKKEFESLKLPRFEKIAVKGSGEQYNHQKIISRFMSSVTPYNELLLFHEMGTGKTCTAIAAIEQIRYEKNKHINGAIVCAKGSGLLNNFSQELLFSCTDGRYIPDNYDKLSDLERIHRTRKITSMFYQFHTFETFAKEISKMPDEVLKQRFSNNIFVIDEVHNIREKDDTTRDGKNRNESLDIYKQFHRLFHVIRESKILLMSGTVMKDDPSEFASVMNLILPLDNQFPVDREFNKTYFGTDGTIKHNMIQNMATKIKGRISYLKTMTSDVMKVFVGHRRIGDLRHFIVYHGIMSDFQTRAYVEAYEKDKKDKSIFINSRQASLFVFPNGSYGTDGFNKYIVKRGGGIRTNIGYQRKKQGKATYTLSSELIRIINRNPDNLYQFSNKFAETIKIILSEPKMKALVYCEYVNGSGCILFAKILDQFGFTQARGDERSKDLRYALLTHQTTSQKNVQQLINRFNKDDNVDGDYISVIIGSKIISEGFTFKNIRKEFIFTPHWNYSETAQVIARGWRLGSHNALIERGDKNLKVDIYQLVSIPNKQIAINTPSIDLEMYETSEKKDVAMKQVEHIAKLNAFDCPLTIDRNKIIGYDDMRECDYVQCNYQCNGIISTPLDVSTYNIYNTVTTIVENGIRKYFKTNFYLSIDNLYSMFPQLDIFEIVQSIKTFIDKDIQFFNKYGYPSYLKIQGDILYISSDARVPNNDQLADYYTKNLIIQNGDPFKHILEKLNRDEIPTFVENIFMYPDYMRSIISKLPYIVQREILTGSIQAEMLDIQKNKDTRQKILTFFKGFYDKINDSWVVWLHKETLGIVCLENERGQMKWVQCHNQEPEIVDRHIMKKKDELIKSPIGFYGLYNPQLNEFCLRDIRTVTIGVADLRKITIGRRCTDWDQNTLVDIIVRKIKIEPPVDFMNDIDIEDYDNIASKVRKFNKHNKLPDDVQNMQVMRRFLYWIRKPRLEICANIQEWMSENNLIEENFDCGTQKKQRAKFLL